jgi:hypothetical protein
MQKSSMWYFVKSFHKIHIYWVNFPTLVKNLWKEGNITALFKKGDKTEPGNYRPVSLTSVICKTMEKLVRETIVKHMHMVQDTTLWYPACDMMAFGLSAIYNYFLYSVAKKTFDPLNYFLTYFIPMHLMQKSYMWYFVKSFHKIHIYRVNFPTLVNNFGPLIYKS